MIKRIRKSFSNRSETFNSFLWRALQIIGKQGVTFLIFIMSAKLLSIYEFGVYNYSLTIVFLLTVFGDCGISIATSKYVAEYNAIDKDKLRMVLFNSALIISILAVIICILALVFGRHIFGIRNKYITFLLPLVFLVPMTSLYDGIYTGLKRFKLLALISLTVGAISLGGVYFLIKRYGVIGAILAQDIFYLIIFISLALAYKDFKFKLNKEVVKEIGGYSILIGLANLGIFLYFRFDVLVLGLFNYINEIALYEVANKILLFLIIPWTILSQVLAPDITKYFAEKKYKVLAKKLKDYSSLSIAFGIVISTAVFFIAKPLMASFLPKYNNRMFYLFLNIMVMVLPVRMLGTLIVGSFIIPIGKARIVAYINLIFGVFKVFLNIMVIRILGAVGILVSTLLMDYVSVFTAHYILTKNLNIGER